MPSPARRPAIRVRPVGRYLLKAFGDMPPEDIGKAHADKYMRDRLAGRIGSPASGSAVWLELAKLKAAVNYSIKRKKLPATAKPDFELPEEPETRDRWLRHEEAAKLLEQARAEREGGRLSRSERFIMLAIETAARRRAMETLTWAQVDFETGVIHYHRHGDARTKKRRPSVPISKALRKVLERARAGRNSDYVLDNPGQIWRAVARCPRRAGLCGVSPHVLLYTSATWMARRGVPLWKIAGVLGNTMRIAEKVYAKHSPDGLTDAVEAISEGRLSLAA